MGCTGIEFKVELSKEMGLLVFFIVRPSFTNVILVLTFLSYASFVSSKVFNYLSNLKSFTEPSNVNSLEDVDCTDSDETLWKLINAKILYKSGTEYFGKY